MATVMYSEQMRRAWSVTPEVPIAKHIDNSRLVKVSDPARRRELAYFACALGLVFLVVMFYAWQHYRAIEYGYQIEIAKAQRDTLIEQNRQLRLEEAYLRSPDRMVPAAQQLGLTTPQVGQVMRLEAPGNDNGPVVAQVATVVIPAAH